MTLRKNTQLREYLYTYFSLSLLNSLAFVTYVQGWARPKMGTTKLRCAIMVTVGESESTIKNKSVCLPKPNELIHAVWLYKKLILFQVECPLIPVRQCGILEKGLYNILIWNSGSNFLRKIYISIPINLLS